MKPVYGNVVEWNVAHDYKGYDARDSKYNALHKLFDKLDVYAGNDNRGWLKVSFENAGDARRAQTAISQYCARKNKDAPWRHQTSVSVDDGVAFLYLRKVMK